MVLHILLLLGWLLQGHASRLEAHLDEPPKVDYYTIMNLSRDATYADIRRNFKKLALQRHPDKPNGDTEAFKDLQEAFEVLSDPKRRGNYDAESRQWRPNWQPTPPAGPGWHAPRPRPRQAPTTSRGFPYRSHHIGDRCRDGSSLLRDVFENYCVCDVGLTCQGPPKMALVGLGCLEAKGAAPAMHSSSCVFCRCVPNGQPQVAPPPVKPAGPCIKGRYRDGSTLRNGVCVCPPGRVCIRESSPDRRGCNMTDIQAFEPSCSECACTVDFAMTRRCCQLKTHEGTRYEWKYPEVRSGKKICPKSNGKWRHAEDQLCDKPPVGEPAVHP